MKQNTTNKQNMMNANSIEYRFMAYSDIGNRLLSFLMDACIMLSPMMLWNIVVLGVLGSILSVKLLFIVNVAVAVLLIVSIFLFNSILLTRSHGQTLGMQLFSFRIISQSGKVANQHQLRVREFLGFDVPFVILMMFTNMFGVGLYWIINGLVVLIDPKHRSIIDFITRTMMVAVTPDAQDKIVAVDEPIKQAQDTEGREARVALNHIDLHIHSNFSANGEYNVEEIFQIAQRKGIKTIALTDIDTVKSNVLAKRMSELYHVNYVPGIEINAQLHGKRVRMLGYFIDYNNEIFVMVENKGLVAEKNAGIERVHKFEQLLGMNIDVNYLLENNRFQKIPGEMIANYVLHHKAYHKCAILQPYLQPGVQHPERLMSKDYFSYGKPCYVAVKYPDVKDVIDLITLCDGVPILAHPGKLLSQSATFLTQILDLGVQGVEAFHPMHTRNEMAELLRIAKERKLFITCGSGFYRENRGISMGCCACPAEAEALVDMFIKANVSYL